MENFLNYHIENIRFQLKFYSKVYCNLLRVQFVVLAATYWFISKRSAKAITYYDKTVLLENI